MRELVLWRHAAAAARIIIYQPPSWEWHERECERRAVTPAVVRAVWEKLQEMKAQPKSELHDWMCRRWWLERDRALITTTNAACEFVGVHRETFSMVLARLRTLWMTKYQYRWHRISLRVRPRSAADVIAWDLLQAVPEAPDGTRVIRHDEMRRLLGQRSRQQITRLHRLGCLTHHDGLVALRVSGSVPDIGRLYWAVRDTHSEWNHMRDLVDAAPLWEELPVVR